MSNLKRKRRDLITPFPSGKGRVCYNADHPNISKRNTCDPWGTVPGVDYKGNQVTDSMGHPWPSRNRGTFQGDLGGEFYTVRTSAEVLNPEPQGMKAVDLSNKITRHYIGPIYACRPVDMFAPSLPTFDTSLESAGTTAISRVKPTNSVADTSTALGELLKDGLPDLPAIHTLRDRTLHVRNSGKEFLNVEFGWQPLVSDVRKFAHAVSHAHSVLAQFRRDSGRMVRRKYYFPAITSTSVVSDSPNGRAFYNPTATIFTDPKVASTNLLITDFTWQQRWFSGAFTYHVPGSNSLFGKLERYALEADKLLGIQLTPEVLWELSPWSWAIDWFSNLGDVVSNLSDWSTYGLVMQYGYMMEHSIRRRTYARPTTGLIDRSVSASPIVLTIESKRRIKANPFGFGITWEGLNPLQLAIAAALGISRL